MNDLLKLNLKVKLIYVTGVILLCVLISIFNPAVLGLKCLGKILEFLGLGQRIIEIANSKDWHFLEFFGLNLLAALISSIFACCIILFNRKFDLLNSPPRTIYILMPIAALLSGGIALIVPTAFIGSLVYFIVAPIPAFIGNYLIVKLIRQIFRDAKNNPV